MAETIDEKLREYAEWHGALNELEKTKGWQVFVDRLRHDAQDHRNLICAGRLDIEKYRHECGVLAGLAQAVNVPAVVKSEYETLLAASQ